MELARTETVANGSITRLAPTGDGRWRTTAFNDQDHLHAAGAPTTHHGIEVEDARA